MIRYGIQEPLYVVCIRGNSITSGRISVSEVRGLQLTEELPCVDGGRVGFEAIESQIGLVFAY